VAEVSPGLTAGGGLKLTYPVKVLVTLDVSPGLTAGGGLKPAPPWEPNIGGVFPPASPPGAD